MDFTQFNELEEVLQGGWGMFIRSNYGRVEDMKIWSIGNQERGWMVEAWSQGKLMFMESWDPCSWGPRAHSTLGSSWDMALSSMYGNWLLAKKQTTHKERIRFSLSRLRRPGPGREWVGKGYCVVGCSKTYLFWKFYVLEVWNLPTLYTCCKCIMWVRDWRM